MVYVTYFRCLVLEVNCISGLFYIQVRYQALIWLFLDYYLRAKEYIERLSFLRCFLLSLSGEGVCSVDAVAQPCSIVLAHWTVPQLHCAERSSVLQDTEVLGSLCTKSHLTTNIVTAKST